TQDAHRISSLGIIILPTNSCHHSEAFAHNDNQHTMGMHRATTINSPKECADTHAHSLPITQKEEGSQPSAFTWVSLLPSLFAAPRPMT
ncbi:hypothetical protein PMAYCL1PPCAC_13912, partial [Pristionchus mayeri]